MDKRLQRILEVSLVVLAIVVIAGIAKQQEQKSQPAEVVMAEATQEKGIAYGEKTNTGAGGKASVGIEAEILNELLTEPDEYASLAIANVSNYVNVRSKPDTESEIVGKIYDGAVAQILSVAGENEDWFRVVSGNVEGYIKAEYFIYGEAAADIVDRYVTASEEFVYAKTIEEEQAELEAQKALEEREEHSGQEAPELVSTVTPPETSYTSNEELRKGIVDYAMQYLGNKYVHGGSSLAGGTDCSGFTCLVYAQFGYSISRTPGGQYSSGGRSISQEELQPGDIVCYSSNGGKSCTHVGFYIGNGQILHSANSRKGVIISDINYSPVIGMKNVID